MILVDRDYPPILIIWLVNARINRERIHTLNIVLVHEFKYISGNRQTSENRLFSPK